MPKGKNEHERKKNGYYVRDTRGYKRNGNQKAN